MSGLVRCGATASQCVCSKPAGHLDAGDPDHACTDDGCKGIWRGDYHGDDDSFRIVQSPLGGRIL